MLRGESLFREEKGVAKVPREPQSGPRRSFLGKKRVERALPSFPLGWGAGGGRENCAMTHAHSKRRLSGSQVFW